MKPMRIACMLVVLLGSAGCDQQPSQPFPSNETRSKRADAEVNESISETRTKAEGGDPTSQSSLALRYYAGKGVEKDIPEALKWWRKAAEQGDAYSQFCIGRAYERGVTVPTNFNEAVKWYRKAADQ